MKIEIPEGKQILVFTGPESSGKTTAAERLSTEYNLPLVHEYAREHLEKKGPEYTFDDLIFIANTQVDLEKNAYNNHDLILCDTDLLTIRIWASDKFQKELNLVDFLQEHKHYLLCLPDIPWENDPLRENPTDRDRLFHIYETELKKMNASYTIVDQDARNQLRF